MAKDVSSSTSSDVPLQPLSSSGARREEEFGIEPTPEVSISRPGTSRSQPRPSSPESPLSHLRARISLFGNKHDDGDNGRPDDAHSESGSEYELLIDPNLPADYSQRHQALPRHSLSSLDRHHHAGTRPKTSLDAEAHEPLVGAEAGEEDDDDDDHEGEEVEDSPYPEVRAAVHPYDDPSLPCNTVRAWTIGLALIFLGASMNTLFSLRSPNISLGALIAQVIAWYVNGRIYSSLFLSTFLYLLVLALPS